MSEAIISKELQQILSEEIKLYEGPFYKFIDFESAKISLSLNNIRFSTPDTLNDPLECCTELLKIKDPEKFKEDTYRNLSKREMNPLKKIGLIENFPKYMKLYNVKKDFSKILSNSIREIGICSFSKHYTKDTDYLLWSHYTKGHKGICIEYDFDSKFLQENRFIPILVNYKNQLDSYEIDFKKGSNDLLPWSVQKLKKIWAYEDEVRLINYNLQPDCYGKYHPSIKKAFVSKIIFGCNCSKANMECIFKILSDKKYDLKKIKFEKMKLNSEQKLKPKEIIL
ncbi:DUF2971 domain-containing protein [Labilibaculum sp.]|uniref:DUF2971 domain-containing protein n=1 Tax=Labilibaculum sp. TaxID=2060723 RepID=UPI0035630F6E